MRDAIQKRGCHFCIAKDRDPFTELEVCRDDDTGLLIELADQVEQQCAAGLWEPEGGTEVYEKVTEATGICARYDCD